MRPSSLFRAVAGIALCAVLILPAAARDIDFGDDTSEWANDGECDDPRFAGDGAADEMADVDLLRDATDCQAAFEAGTVSVIGETVEDMTGDIPYVPSGDTPAARINFGDDTGEWANDGECDDPDFTGAGMAQKPSSSNRLRDATDCRAAFEAGTISLGAGATPVDIPAFDYGADGSRWANDGECDDLRFEGAAADKKLLTEDMYGDATDCQALEAEGRVNIRQVYTPEYAAGAPYDGSDIDFGDNASSYADDEQCDDPRFEGPGAATTLLDGDLEHDANDCKAAYEAGTIILLDDA